MAVETTIRQSGDLSENEQTIPLSVCVSWSGL